jgi:S1-C subfamily serine protease
MMRANLWRNLIVMSLLMMGLALPTIALGRHGGGGGGKGRIGKKWAPPDQPVQPPADPKQVEADRQATLAKLLAEGFTDLKAGDRKAAADCFADALQLAPESAEAHLGMGLAQGLANPPATVKAQSDLETALRGKIDARLCNYNLGVLFFRSKQEVRAIVAFNNYQATLKDVPDELIFNAQATVIAGSSDEQRKDFATLQDILKGQSKWETTLSKKYPQMTRWGLQWMPTDAVEKLKAANSNPVYPHALPYLLPDGTFVDEKGQLAGANPLLPAPVFPALAKSDVGGGGEAGGTNNNLATPVVETPQANPEPADNRPAMVSIARGSAFAIGADLLVTTASLVDHAVDISVQSADGKHATATVTATDAASGLALLHIRGGTFTPVALAAASKPGPVVIATFSKVSIFNTDPSLDLLRGELFTSNNTLYLKTSTQPRSTGSPVTTENGEVVAVYCGSRDDAMTQLPVIPVETLRKFVEGKVKLADESTGSPQEAVVELTVARKR